MEVTGLHWKLALLADIATIAGVVVAVLAIESSRRDANRRAALRAVELLVRCSTELSKYDPQKAWDNAIGAVRGNPSTALEANGRSLIGYMNAIEGLGSALEQAMRGKDDIKRSIRGLLHPLNVSRKRIEEYRKAEESAFGPGMAGRSSDTFKAAHKLLGDPLVQYPKGVET